MKKNAKVTSKKRWELEKFFLFLFFRPRVFGFSPPFPFNIEGVRRRRNMYTQHGNCEWYSRNRNIKLWEKQNMFAFHWTTQLTSEVYASNASWEPLFLGEERAFPMETWFSWIFHQKTTYKIVFFSFFETIVCTQFSPSKGDCAQMLTMKHFAHAPPKIFSLRFRFSYESFMLTFLLCAFIHFFFPSPSFLVFLHRISFREKLNVSLFSQLQIFFNLLSRASLSFRRKRVCWGRKLCNIKDFWSFFLLFSSSLAKPKKQYWM